MAVTYIPPNRPDYTPLELLMNGIQLYQKIKQDRISNLLNETRLTGDTKAVDERRRMLGLDPIFGAEEPEEESILSAIFGGRRAPEPVEAGPGDEIAEQMARSNYAGAPQPPESVVYQEPGGLLGGIINRRGPSPEGVRMAQSAAADYMDLQNYLSGRTTLDTAPDSIRKGKVQKADARPLAPAVGVRSGDSDARFTVDNFIDIKEKVRKATEERASKELKSSGGSKGVKEKTAEAPSRSEITKLMNLAPGDRVEAIQGYFEGQLSALGGSMAGRRLAVERANKYIDACNMLTADDIPRYELRDWLDKPEKTPTSGGKKEDWYVYDRLGNTNHFFSSAKEAEAFSNKLTRESGISHPASKVAASAPKGDLEDALRRDVGADITLEKELKKRNKGDHVAWASSVNSERAKRGEEHGYVFIDEGIFSNSAKSLPKGEYIEAMAKKYKGKELPAKITGKLRDEIYAAMGVADKRAPAKRTASQTDDYVKRVLKGK